MVKFFHAAKNTTLTILAPSNFSEHLKKIISKTERYSGR